MSFDPVHIAGVARGTNPDVAGPRVWHAPPLDGVLTCTSIFGPYEIPEVVSSYAATIDRDTAAVEVATFDDPDFVQVSWTYQDGPEGGYTSCSSDLSTPATWEWNVSMVGFGALDFYSADGIPVGDYLPLPGSGIGIGAIPNAYILRPTALTWPGQDPANEANRTLWLASEIAEIHEELIMSDLAGYDFTTSTNYIYPYNIVPSDPVICFV